MDFKGKRVTVMGLGSFGGQIGAARFLADEDAAEIIITDVKSADQLADSLGRIADLPRVTLHLGGHVEVDFTTVDAVVVSPAVPKDSPLLAAARAAGVPLTSEMNLLFERCPARIVGVTGTAGKSTTTALVHAVLAAGAPAGSTVHLGGNIGHHALLPRVRRIAPGDLVVLELSSFQLADLGEPKQSPHVAVVTNIAPNHLDRHGTMAAYVAAKQNVLRFQGPDDQAVLNGEDPALADWAPLTAGRVRWFRCDDADGLALRVVGRHNRSNAAAALAVGRALDIPDPVIAAALAEVRPLPHRLAPVGQADGVRYYNDSKSTTPRAALTALEALAGPPLIVIVGGYDKKLDLEPLCRELAARTKAVVAIGQTRARFAELIKKHRAAGAEAGVVQTADDLREAVQVAAALAAPGDVVLLSPGCASYDQFANYEQRGERFGDLVRRLP